MNEIIQFEKSNQLESIIKVIGVGGAGSNAVNHMFKQGIQGVEFMICNTDAQSLDISPVPHKIQLGSSLTDGRGAGSMPEVGRNAAIENIEDIKAALSKNTKMLFITAGMGGGTGTGAAPVIAAAAKELGILTIAIVNIPFAFEGRKRNLQAQDGLSELRKNIDALLVISNDKLRELFGNKTLTEGFSNADNILTEAAKGIAEIITVPGYINVDFEDVKTVMRDSGVAIMGTGRASGLDRAKVAVEEALSSPLLNDSEIKGARNILLYISSGVNEITMDEITEITDYIQDEAGQTAEIIWGNGRDENLGEDIKITVVATGFEPSSHVQKVVASQTKKAEPTVHILETETTEIATEVVASIKEETIELDPVPSDEYLFEFKVSTVEAAPNQIQKTESTADFSQALFTPTQVLNQVENKEVTIYDLGGNEPTMTFRNKETIETTASTLNSSIETFNKNAQNRISSLRTLSTYPPASNPVTLAEIERVPAYVRQGIALKETPASNDTNVSRYSLDGTTGEINTSNSFLHDNVD